MREDILSIADDTLIFTQGIFQAISGLKEFFRNYQGISRKLISNDKYVIIA